ncbi:MAG TPA: SRPBCC family protein [Gemmatimonas sp.]|uniref:SRPBCC family protein n=1 Tax=Gemmatimonas sp. TaxID=1962908 RepID=UPI002ED95361
MIRKVLLVVLLLVVVLLGYASTKPDSFSVERSIDIAAPPERVHALINDFHAWEAWSPWAKLDTAMTVTYSGPPSGVGAVYEWTGNSSVGAGRMEITSSTPGTSVGVKLDFLKPIEGHNVTTFSLTPKDGGTNVRWLMEGPATFMTKLMMTVTSMDKMIGPDFEKGLQQLKATAESAPAATAPAAAPAVDSTAAPAATPVVGPPAP